MLCAGGRSEGEWDGRSCRSSPSNASSSARQCCRPPALFQRTADGLALPSKLDPVVWTIPGKETKKGLAHEVPLSGAAIELLRALATSDEDERIKINTLYRAKKQQPARAASEYVFPSRAVNGFSWFSRVRRLTQAPQKILRRRPPDCRGWPRSQPHGRHG
jgi:hypothetical protein